MPSVIRHLSRWLILVGVPALSTTVCSSGGNDDDDDDTIPSDDDDDTVDDDDDDDTQPTLPNPSVIDEARLRGIHLSWLGDPSTTMAITWHSDREEEAAGLWWGESEDALVHPVEATPRFFEGTYSDAEKKMVHIYWAEVTGLSPNTTYHYKLVNADASSATYAFTTGPEPGSEDPIVFMVLGDNRGESPAAPSERFPEMLDRLKTENYDFAVNTGDVTNGSFADEWETYWEMTRGAFESRVMMHAMGNHDIGFTVVGNAYLNHLTQDHNDQRKYYRFEYGNILFLMADANDPDFSTGQDAYLRNAIAESEAKWIVLVYHQAAYSPSTRHGSIKKVQESLVPLNDGLGVDVNFNGHDHVYGRTHWLYGRNTEVTLPEGQGSAPMEVCDTPPCARGTLYLTTGGAGAGLYGAFNDPGDDVNEEVARMMAYSCGRNQECYNYLKVTVTGSQMTLEAFDIEGNKIDEMTFNNIHR